jgi:N,N'-diacetyllegionaminate synthase
MARCLIVAELATAHGGNVDLAEDMIRAAADAGADYAKLQTYDLAKLNPNDPQAAWLIQSHLDEAAHERLIAVGLKVGIEVFSTPFDADSLRLLRSLGLKRFKVASSESGNDWWQSARGEQWIVSWAWGRQILRAASVERDFDAFSLGGVPGDTHLTAIPLYPTPLECVGRATLLDGWSCHGDGITACQWAIANGAQMVEAHLALPGRSRVTAWDKSPTEFRILRKFAEDVCTIASGVKQQYRERWSA